MNTVTVNADDDHATILQAFKAELRDPADPLSLFVRFKIEVADGEKVEAAFGRTRSLTPNEPACRAYDLNRDPRDPSRFVVYEQWRTLADLDAHLWTATKSDFGAPLPS